MINLYEYINCLRLRRQGLRETMENIKHTLPFNEEAYNINENRCDIVEKQIAKIERDDRCNIDIRTVGKMIKSYTGCSYEFKVFTEQRVRDRQTSYNYQFVACFVNENNPYYDKKNTNLYPDEYIDLVRSLSKDNSILISSSDNIDFMPSYPKIDIEEINFIYLFTRGYLDDIISKDFAQLVKPILEAQLKTIELKPANNLSSKSV